MSTTTISIKTYRTLLSDAKGILDSYGFTLSSAFNTYLNDIRSKRIIPSCENRYVPKHITDKWKIDADEAIKNGKRYSSTEELMKDLMS